MKRIILERKTQLTYLLTIGVLYYILCHLTPITLSDDTIYQFVWPYDNESFSSPISSILDVIKSQYIHYQVLNGRSIIHFFVQLFDGIIGKEVCDIISSILFGSLIYMASTISSQGKNTLLGISIISTMLFLLMPGFHNEFLLFVGQFNYLWTAVTTMGFIFIINHIREKKISICLLSLSTSSFFFGWLHEGITFPIALTLIIYCICNYHRQNILKSPIFYYTFFYTLGAIICLFSPGTMQRIGQQEPLSQLIIQKFILGGVNLLHLRISYLMLAISLFSFYKKKEMWKKHFQQYKYFYLTWLFSFIPVFGSGSTETRVIFYTEFIAMIIATSLLLNHYSFKYKTSIIISCNIVILLMYAIVLHYSLENHKNEQYILQQLQNQKIEIISVPQIKPISNPILSYIFDNYLREPVKFGPFENAQGFVQNNAHVKCIKILFNKEKLYFLPKDIVEKLKKNQIRKSFFIYNTHKELIILEIKENCQIKEVKLLLKDEDINTLPFYKRFLAYRADSYIIPEGYYETLVYNQKKYLIICCPTRNISRRLKNITYIYK